MPFIKPELRQGLLEGHISPSTPGDLCFIEYAKILAKWRDSPRWTTCHAIFKDLWKCDDAEAAKTLAFLVFFMKFVMPYEDDREKENGTI